MPTLPPTNERNLAVFIDLENLALGFAQRNRAGLDINRVLERLLEKGKLIAKKAYADWSRFAQYTAPFHEAAVELIEIPRRAAAGKNSADIRLVVDAMDLSWSKSHVDTFVIVSGDSDFSPLVSKLKENGKHVIGVGMRGSTSALLRDNCDEFLYYEDLELQGVDREALGLDSSIPQPKREVFALVLDACAALRRENHQQLQASMIKDTIKRKKPSFDETSFGYRSFTHLLEDVQAMGFLEIQREPRSGTWAVKRFSSERAIPLVTRRARRRTPHLQR